MRRWRRGLLAGLACGGVLGCTRGAETPAGGEAARADTAAVPLTDLGSGTYHGLPGGLYPGGANQMPAGHSARGRARAALVVPRDAAGRPDAAGKVVLLSVGMSNTSQEFCNPPDHDPLACRGDAPFIPRALRDPAVDRRHLALANGARGSHAVDDWDHPADTVYRWVRQRVLAPQGLAEAQVQVVWLKQANRGSPTRPSLPAAQADAHVLLQALGRTVRALRVRYPNLQQVFVSSRSYGGYAASPATTNSPEPYAYETGFAVKWLVEAQIRQAETGRVDPLAGDLGPAAAPWIAWGPYPWADGMRPRSDGLVWRREDFHADGIHPTPAGQAKVATMLLDFFKSAPEARCWFLAGQTCAAPAVVPLEAGEPAP